jgi:hypothetical protein
VHDIPASPGQSRRAETEARSFSALAGEEELRRSAGPLSADDGRMRSIRNVNTAGYRSLAVAAALMTLPGCRVAGDIFKAGMWVAVIGIAIVVLLGYGLASLFRR